MPAANARAQSSLLAVVDIQPSFLSGIFEAERVLHRAEFLLKIAGLLQVPILATEQNPARMGATHERILPLVTSPPLEKMAFSCAGCTAFSDSLVRLQRTQIVLIGIETHICISQTALDLLTRGFEVIVCADAVSARSSDRHSLGLGRIRDAGA